MSTEPPRGQLREGGIKSSEFENRRAIPNAEYSRILADCRDLISHRLLVSLTSMMDRLSDGLLAQANRSNVLSESTLLLESRSVLQSNRAYIVNAFEKALRARIDRRLHGEPEPPALSPQGDQPLELVDHEQVEEEIAIKNFTRSIANRCHDELAALNGRIGFLTGERHLSTEENAFGPYAVGAAFGEAWEAVDIRREGKVIILKMMDAGVIGDINSVYADINRHLANLNVLPTLQGGQRMNMSESYGSIASTGHAPGGRASEAGAHAPAQEVERDAMASVTGDDARPADGDLFAMLRDLLSRRGRPGGPGRAAAAAASGIASAMGAPAGNGAEISSAQFAAFLPWLLRAAGRNMAAGAAGGAVPANTSPGPMVATQAYGGGHVETAGADSHVIITSLTRLQQSYGRVGNANLLLVPGGAVGVDGGAPAAVGVVAAAGDVAAAGGATTVGFDPYLLRRLGPAELGSPIDPTGAVTIELVAMLFDFVSAEGHVPEAIKSLLYRLQIPVLKAALLDKEFFSRRTHPARLLVNRYAEAGIAWRVEQGPDDPLFRKIQEGVERIQADFTDQLDLFAEVLSDFETFVAAEEERAEKRVQTSADEIAQRERQELAHIVADAELDRRINSAQPPEFFVAFLRNQWRQVLINAYLETGEEGAGWRAVLAEMDNLLWSVQPKRKVKDRRDLVTRLPDMLSRLRTRLSDIEWDINAREKFMTELVECHARAVTATMEREAAANAAAKPLSGAMAGNASDSAPAVVDSAPQDQYHGLAESMVRGMWVEFAEESGILVFAKLSWVSPLRGKYLFTHRNGTKAFSLTREELAQRFRSDTARPVETEPLLDRAFSDVLSRLSAQAGVS